MVYQLIYSLLESFILTIITQTKSQYKVQDNYCLSSTLNIEITMEPFLKVIIMWYITLQTIESLLSCLKHSIKFRYLQQAIWEYQKVI